ncbi:MAG: hypothetical protein JST00_40115 [Deltaproteobacteria bacterium]|nr:hypothetical protein [Deltaproteobacteria bacterium]
MTPTALESLVGTWSRPPDTAGKVALALSLASVVLAVSGRGRSILGLGPMPIPRRLFLWITGFLAALLSVVYIAHYLKGGPRIIDATAYFLQGRALSHGDLTWTPAEPTASFRSRFLVEHGGVVGGIFPPGYPFLLALGFGLGAPMVVGPAIAAAIVVATHRLARTIAEEAIGRDMASEPLVEAVARAAALLSVVSGALRYHTADTMSHGATALAVTIALDAALRKRAALAGLAIGWVILTRPVSAAPITVVTAILFARTERAKLRALALGILPGAVLFLLAQKAVTGSWLTSSQRMYYALSDGPPGCFRWGFGEGTGCIVEHGEFVEARLPHGYGLVAAVGTTLRRLKMHLLDVANLEPLALLVLAPALRKPRSRATLYALALVGLQIAAYAPFYFDGNYPGGGARFFADVLPVEHVLLALGAARLSSGVVAYLRSAFGVLALSFAGFSVHASHEHVKLMNRDGGAPMFEPDVLARQNVTNNALVFVETDHGFLLAHDPSARTKTGVVVARLRQDDRDRMVYEALERPTSYWYKLEADGPKLIPWAPPAFEDPFRFEMEAEWPARSQIGGYAAPAYTDACAGNARALVVAPVPAKGRATVTVSVPVPSSGRYGVTPRIVHGGTIPFSKVAAGGTGTLRLGTAVWRASPAATGGCQELGAHELTLTAPSATLTIEAEGGAFAVDRITLKRRQ